MRRHPDFAISIVSPNDVVEIFNSATVWFRVETSPFETSVFGSAAYQAGSLKNATFRGPRSPHGRQRQNSPRPALDLGPCSFPPTVNPFAAGVPWAQTWTSVTGWPFHARWHAKGADVQPSTVVARSTSSPCQVSPAHDGAAQDHDVFVFARIAARTVFVAIRRFQPAQIRPRRPNRLGRRFPPRGWVLRNAAVSLSVARFLNVGGGIRGERTMT